jgi:hypothetical protein
MLRFFFMPIFASNPPVFASQTPPPILGIGDNPATGGHLIKNEGGKTMAEFASKGVGGTALGLSIGALGAQVLTGGLGNLFGGLGANGNCNSDNMPVNRYEAAQNARIAALETEVKLRDANTYTDQKLLDVYKYVDGKFGRVEHQLCDQSVWNATQTATIGCMAQQIAALNGLTKTIIPADNICPPPMPLYNSWTAPTAPTTGA